MQSLQRNIRKLEKYLKLNEDLRSQHPNNPSLFLESEVDLDEQIGMFRALAAHAELLPHFTTLHGIHLLVSLLSHPNPGKTKGNVCLEIVLLL